MPVRFVETNLGNLGLFALGFRWNRNPELKLYYDEIKVINLDVSSVM